MKKLPFLLLIVSACDYTQDRATTYLLAMGHKSVTCTGAGDGSAICSADDRRFRCVVTNSTGCSHQSSTACERLVVERD